MKKRALLSVSNKNSLAPFAASLVELGFEILSTGGTARSLREAGLSVTDVSDITDFPEMMDGRVKTLHPAIHGGLLARRDLPAHMEAIASQNIAPIDLVCVNLYPFEETVAKPGVELAEAVENIDIGGPSMVRSAAKNYQFVTVVVDPADYLTVLEELRGGDTTLETRKKLATKAFAHTSAYDAAITTYLSGETMPTSLRLPFEKAFDLRYGENPHQKAAFYLENRAVAGSLASAKQLSGIALSFVNLFDLDGAWNLVCEFDEPAACIVKHANPCGCAIGATLSEAFVAARDADPVSRFGGIIACNRVVDEETAREIIVKNSLYHAIIAPGYEAAALELLQNRSGWGADLRILDAETTLPRDADLDIKRVSGGLLVQDLDRGEASELKVVTQKAPDENQMRDLKFAWKCVKHLKSNAIAVAKNGSLIGAGAGQMNRVSSVELALKGAGENVRGAVLASDAFFPFDDGPEMAAKAGIAAIIQPGGSNRDADSIALCNREGVAMIFSGMRHFKH
ncbi:IMP cyclohydrolase /phosphoribosylaminoimidazolecarboxamide formyltransferase [Abditibacterium utsteinense]|uniref:Bifunctional purine biosynthesis protein PurH n=1 Tax=Abditibacterium utsteinense TaxID=1960156 RepID=A0A2S8SSL4_9BACT|nr:bifunctional phosphoribosylaminoimidazolecarboxamide formyltransferase/IMP cyclohydrolase [Abditibacterium utsteinense]PQV63803.1 IMP cyclohydrolase /phosphoribosylaminoimidazolecarboxamide formyltransferase [Abditibacterium utsteinense]